MDQKDIERKIRRIMTRRGDWLSDEFRKWESAIMTDPVKYKPILNLMIKNTAFEDIDGNKDMR